MSEAEVCPQGHRHLPPVLDRSCWTTPPPGEAGWEQRLENLARAQEGAAELREGIARWFYRQSNPDRFWDAEWLDRTTFYESADALIAGPLAPLLEAQAAVQRVEALADQLEAGERPGLVGFAYDVVADRIRAAIDVSMAMRPLYGPWGDEQARTGVRGSGRCGATERDERE